jgi:hypothetical protein
MQVMLYVAGKLYSSEAYRRSCILGTAEMSGSRQKIHLYWGMLRWTNEQRRMTYSCSIIRWDTPRVKQLSARKASEELWLILPGV